MGGPGGSFIGCGSQQTGPAMACASSGCLLKDVAFPAAVVVVDAPRPLGASGPLGCISSAVDPLDEPAIRQAAAAALAPGARSRHRLVRARRVRPVGCAVASDG